MVGSVAWRRAAMAALVLLGVLAFNVSTVRFGPRRHFLGDQLVSTSWPPGGPASLLGVTLGLVATGVLVVLAARRSSRPLALCGLAAALVTGLVALGPAGGLVATALAGFLLRPALRA